MVGRKEKAQRRKDERPFFRWYGVFMAQRYDTIIVGQGLAGTTLAWKLIEAGENVLVVDSERGQGASAVAAGLMTPVTGKRMVCSPTFQEDWEAAIHFYQQIETKLEADLLSIGPLIRLFDRQADRQNYLDRSDRQDFVEAEPWEGTLEAEGSVRLGVKIWPSGRLNVERYLSKSRQFFKQQGSYQQGHLAFDGDVQFGDRHYQLVNDSVEAKSLVLCQGAVVNEKFPQVPNNPAKGEILKVKLDSATIRNVVHRSIWVAPDEGITSEENSVAEKAKRSDQLSDTARPQIFTVGATYDWREFELTPTQKAETELRRKLASIVSQEPKIERTMVGIRPTMKDRQPVLGQHPDFNGLWILNGLGSKGTLKSPILADRLLAAKKGEHKINEAESYQRLCPKSVKGHFPLTTVAQEEISDVIGEGDTVVDATVGRGFDTAFLSKKVGQVGRVIGFDIQKEALEATRSRLAAMGATNVDLMHQGHETAAEVLQDVNVQAVMFNLGFLPRSDKLVITNQSTTIKALSAISNRLMIGGKITLLCYRGHVGGPEEYHSVRNWLKAQPDLAVEKIDSHVTKETAPVLLVVTKKAEFNG